MNRRIDRKKLLIGTYILDNYARTEKHVRELKECGIDVIICLRSPSKEFLDLLWKYGIGCDISGVVPGWWGGDGDNAGKMAGTNPLSLYREGAESFIDHPAVWMIDIGDEPSAKDFDHYGRIAAEMEKLFPNQLPYLNLYPNYASVAENTAGQTVNQLGTPTYADHIREYTEKVGLPYISYDYYIYSMPEEHLGKMYDNFRIVADACRGTGRDFWYIPQCNGRNENDFTSENQMRFQAYCALCYGAVAINWACWTAGWWCNNILDKTGEKTEQYEKLRTVNLELVRLGETYMKYRSVATHMIGFSGVPSVVSERGLNVKNELNCGFVRGLKAEEPGANLLVGEMTGRDDPEKHALTVLNATDHMDKNHAGSLCTVSFRTAARAVRLVSGGSTLPPDFSCVEDNGEKAVTFKLENCRCVMVELAF